MLQAQGVSVSFQGVRALSDVTLELQPGEILGLIGPNGAGKTTLVNVLSGFQRIRSGSVRLDGTDIRGWPTDRIARAGLARTFQGVRPFAQLTVLENLEVGFVSHGRTRHEAGLRSRALLELFGLHERADQRAADLPYGQLRLLGLARALAGEPRYLLVDEPAAGLSETDAEHLRHTLATMRDRTGCGVLVIEHNMQLIMGLCDRVHVLERGSTLAVGTPQAVRENASVRHAYLGASSAASSTASTDAASSAGRPGTVARTGAPVLLDVAQLSVSYGAIPALRDVSLQVGPGEFVSIIGPNGAGKSTLMQAIAGLVRPQRGTITFGGRPLAAVAAEARVREGLALVPEGRGIFAALSVGENLAVGAGLAPAAARSAAAALLERFPILRERHAAPAGSLSGGEQQQLAIARALLSRPRLLLLDEPSLGLAPQVIELVYSILRDLNREGVSILLVEQSAERALGAADRAYVVRSGEVKLHGPAADLRVDPSFDHAYFGFGRKAA